MAKRRPGRPSVPVYTPALAQAICERLAQGESLRAICASAGMPDESTVRLWSRTHEDFIPQYAHAREAGYLVMADELTEIADNENGDPARDRLRVDTRKWLLSKALPKIYGDKQTVETTGGENLTLQVVLVERAASAGDNAKAVPVQVTRVG